MLITLKIKIVLKIIADYEIMLNWLYTKRSAIITTISFIILFPLLTLFKKQISASSIGYSDCFLVTKIAFFSVQRGLKLVYAFVGIIMTLSWVGCYLKRHAVPQWMEKVSALSFGVYLFQQFILKGLYDHTVLPSMLGCYWLPWSGFVVALLGSLLMAYLLRATRFGRFLIG